MKAQVLYDLRERHEFCSGQDLAEFFQEQTGEMSPNGSMEIRSKPAAQFIASALDAIENNSPALAGWAQMTKRSVAGALK